MKLVFGSGRSAPAWSKTGFRCCVSSGVRTRSSVFIAVDGMSSWVVVSGCGKRDGKVLTVSSIIKEVAHRGIVVPR